MDNKLGKRVRSAVIMLPLLLLLVVKGWPLFIAVTAISAAAMYEFYKVFEDAKVKVNKVSGFASFILLVAIVVLDKFIGINTPASQDLILIWLGTTIFAGFAKTLFGKEHDITAGMVTSMGVLYPAFSLMHIVFVSRVPDFSHFVWIIFIATISTDTVAYFVGGAIGKTKLCEEISPKKTVEGAVAGVIASMLCCFLFGLFFAKGNRINCLVIGLLASIAGQLGDLGASVFKRRLGIKDYSALIPGHGGIMDRFDSVMFAAPLVYYYMILFVR